MGKDASTKGSGNVDAAEKQVPAEVQAASVAGLGKQHC